MNMPEGWEVVENPVYFVTGDPYGDNAVGFRSKLSPDADWIYVEVKESNTILTWVPETKLFPQSEYKVFDYGKNGIYLETRRRDGASWSKWRLTYYIQYDGRLYTVTFNTKAAQKRAFVSIDGYGKVNY